MSLVLDVPRISGDLTLADPLVRLSRLGDHGQLLPTVW